MTNSKIKPELNGVAETMLLTFYARAKYSKSPKHAFYDAKAVELVERLDYDFSRLPGTLPWAAARLPEPLYLTNWCRHFCRSTPMQRW